MKTKLFISSLSISLLLCAYQSNAQDNEAGLKGGFNLSNVYSEKIDDQNMRAGFNVGLFFKLPIISSFAIQPEILYTTKGTTAEYDNFLNGDGKFTQAFNYLELPILGVFNLTENFNIHAGPYFSYLLNARIEDKSSNSDYRYVEELDEDAFERVDYGIVVGAGLEFDVARIGLRYGYGLRDIGKGNSSLFNGDQTVSDSFKDQRNSVVSLYLGLNF